MRTFAILLSATALATSGCSAAQPDRIGWQEAAEQINARLLDAEIDRSKVPLLANPADAPLLRAVFDLDGIWAMDRQDFPAISARCVPVRSIGRHYYTLGAVPGRAGRPEMNEKAKRRNSLQYHDELALGAAALLLCTARENHAIERFSAALPVEQRTPFRRDRAVEAGKRGTSLLADYIGLQSTSRSYASDANRRLLLDTLTRAAPALAETLNLDQRAAVRAAIDRELPKLSAAGRTTLGNVRHAFESTDCATLCRITG